MHPLKDYKSVSYHIIRCTLTSTPIGVCFLTVILICLVRIRAPTQLLRYLCEAQMAPTVNSLRIGLLTLSQTFDRGGLFVQNLSNLG